MSSRLFKLTGTGFMSPTVFYSRSANNPKVKARLKKKAEMFVKNWDELATIGSNMHKGLIEGTVSFKDWCAHRRWMEKHKLGVSIRYKFRESLITQYQEAIEYARSINGFD